MPAVFEKEYSRISCAAYRRGSVGHNGKLNTKNIFYFKKGAGGMNTNKNPTAEVTKPQEPYHFKKRLGSTTFHVAVYFNPHAKETAGDKLARLIRNDTTTGKAVNQ